MALTLKRLRKGKIQKIDTPTLEKELERLQQRHNEYTETMDREGKKYKMYKMLEERIINSGEGTSSWRYRSKASDFREIKFSDDKELYLELDAEIKYAEYGIKKIAEKKNLIEMELIDRTLIDQ